MLPISGPNPSAAASHDLGAVESLDMERELPRVEPGEVEKILHEASRAVLPRSDDQAPIHCVVGGPFCECVRISPYRRERGPKLVGNRKRNWRPRPCERARLSPIVLIESASSFSSG